MFLGAPGCKSTPGSRGAGRRLFGHRDRERSDAIQRPRPLETRAAIPPTRTGSRAPAPARRVRALSCTVTTAGSRRSARDDERRAGPGRPPVGCHRRARGRGDRCAPCVGATRLRIATASPLRAAIAPGSPSAFAERAPSGRLCSAEALGHQRVRRRDAARRRETPRAQESSGGVVQPLVTAGGEALGRAGQAPPASELHCHNPSILSLAAVQQYLIIDRFDGAQA